MALKEIWICDRCLAEQDPKGCANATQCWATLTTENHGKVTTRSLKKLLCPKCLKKLEAFIDE